MYRNPIEIGGKKKVLVTISQRDETEQVMEAQSVDKVHHIHVLDRSGSMRDEINQLIDNVQRTIDEIADDDLLSIIWFSSPGEYRTLVKGATKKTANLKKLLDSIRSVLGTTCFSDPIKEVGIIIDELLPLCPNVSITLFTDGQPVVPWGEKEEINRVTKLLGDLRKKMLAFNTVGYGNYYNRDFLVNMSALSEFGTYCHANEIEQYFSIFGQNFEKVSGMVVENVEINHSGEIIYLNRRFSKLEENKLSLSRLDSRKNVFYMFADGDFSFDYQGKRYASKDITTKAPPATITNFHYAYAYNLFYVGKRRAALDILVKDLGDKFLVDQQMAVFSYDEISNYLDLLKKAVFEPKNRLQGGKCNTSYLPAADAHSVMDVLTILATGDAYYLPDHPDAEKYARITKQVVDQFNVFSRDKVPSVAAFEDFVYNKSRLNLSILMKITGNVKLNPNEAKKVNLPEEFPSFIYRTHTVIKDGTLNMKKVVALMPQPVFDELQHKGTTMQKVAIDGVPADFVTEREKETGHPHVCAVIDLGALPIINQKYIDNAMSIDNVFALSRDILKDEAYQKWLKFYLEEIYNASSTAKKEGAFAKLTVDQIAVLENHGIEKSGSYKGVGNKVVPSENGDFYEARSMEFAFKGVSSLPSINEVRERLKDTKKTPTISQQIMIGAMKRLDTLVASKKVDLTKLNTKLRDVLTKELRQTRRTLAIARHQLSALKMAKILTGDWWEGLKNDDKGNFVYEHDGMTMQVKLQRVKEML